MTNKPDITTYFCADLQFNAWQYSWERWSPSRSQDNWNQWWECCRHLAPAHCGALSHHCGRGRFILFFPSASPCLANETALRSPNVSEFRRASDSGSPVVISESPVVDSSVSGFILSRICLILHVLLCLWTDFLRQVTAKLISFHTPFLPFQYLSHNIFLL